MVRMLEVVLDFVNRIVVLHFAWNGGLDAVHDVVVTETVRDSFCSSAQEER